MASGAEKEKKNEKCDNDHEMVSTSDAPKCKSCNDSYAIEVRTIQKIFNTKLRSKEQFCFSCREERALQLQKSFEDKANELGFEVLEKRKISFEDFEGDDFQVERVASDEDDEESDDAFTYCACCECFVTENPCCGCKEKKECKKSNCRSCRHEEDKSKKKPENIKKTFIPTEAQQYSIFDRMFLGEPYKFHRIEVERTDKTGRVVGRFTCNCETFKKDGYCCCYLNENKRKGIPECSRGKPI